MCRAMLRLMRRSRLGGVFGRIDAEGWYARLVVYGLHNGISIYLI